MDEKSRLDRKRLFWRNICELLRLYPVKGANHEQDRIMAFKSAHRWSEIHLSSAAYSRWSVFWEGLLKICIPKSRTGPLHKIGNAFPTLHGDLRGMPGDLWRDAVAFGFDDEADRSPVRRRDDCGNSLDKNFETRAA